MMWLLIGLFHHVFLGSVADLQFSMAKGAREERAHNCLLCQLVSKVLLDQMRADPENRGRRKAAEGCEGSGDTGLLEVQELRATVRLDEAQPLGHSGDMQAV